VTTRMGHTATNSYRHPGPMVVGAGVELFASGRAPGARVAGGRCQVTEAVNRRHRAGMKQPPASG